MVHLGSTVGSPGDVAVAVHGGAPGLFGPGQVHGLVLQVGQGHRYLRHLGGSVGLEVGSGSIVKAKHIGHIGTAPTRQRSAPADGSVQIIGRFPNSVFGTGQYAAQGIKKWIGGGNLDPGSHFSSVRQGVLECGNQVGGLYGLVDSILFWSGVQGNIPCLIAQW
ncbi:MAG: hypothetical protein BWY72_01393 [Bacteroidetes bacterium ADurb.Bin416]|nr:MAG: hypothetical protein BWY72_01393 [Bacteroidetes bacterium ADurb.Bin416]